MINHMILSTDATGFQKKLCFLSQQANLKEYTFRCLTSF